MALALVSRFEKPDLWRRTMATEIPDLDFRVWPNLGDPASIRMAASDYNVPPGDRRWPLAVATGRSGGGRRLQRVRLGARGQNVAVRRDVQGAHEAADVAQVLVGLHARDEPELDRVEPEPSEQRVREQHVRARRRHPVLEQPVGKDDVHAGHLGAAPDRMPEEAAVVSHDLQIQALDVPARAARARLVGRQLTLDLLEGHEGRVEHVEEPGWGYEGAVRAQGEDRVAFDFLDLQRGREPSS